MFGKNKTGGAELEFFTVFDSKAKTYAEPFPAMNSEVVIRDFTTAFRDPEAHKKNRYYMNAEDFSIYKCGNFSLTSGLITGQNLEHIVNMHDLRAMVQPGALTST